MKNASSLEVLFSPAEFEALARRDLSGTVCVVFDILRATTTMMAALANGAREIIPVPEIQEALARREELKDALLAGERQGLRIRADQTGGIDFDLGNSPREFTAQRVGGKTIVMTTTNGTRALRACAPAQATLIGSFSGMKALARWIERELPAELLLVGSGTHEQAAFEDTLAAGALCDLVWPLYGSGEVADSAQIARQLYHAASGDLLEAMGAARNARRLLGIPELKEDIGFCLERDRADFVAALVSGAVRKEA